MTLAYLGGLSVGGAAPGAAVAVDAGIAGAAPGLDSLTAQLGALTAYVPLPIDFAAQLAVAKDLAAGLKAALDAALVPPSVDVQAAVIAAQVATLQISVDAINAQLSVLTELSGPLAVAGVHGYAFDGSVSQLGDELDAMLGVGVPGGTPSDHANAVIYVTTSAATWDAMAAVFKVTP